MALDSTKLITSYTTSEGLSKTISERMYKSMLEKNPQSVIQSESVFSPQHPWYKKYGVTKLRVDSYPTGTNFYTLEADVFGQKMNFKADNCNLKHTGGRSEVAEMLKSLKKARAYKPTSFLKNVVNIAKHIR